MKDSEHHVLAKVRLFTENEGGRSTPSPTDKLHLVFEVDNNLFDCRLWFGDLGSVLPGATFEASITFLSPALVLPKLQIGKKFKLRDLRLIGIGEVVSIEKETQKR